MPGAFWEQLGVDEDGEAVHIPELIGDTVYCRCRNEECPLDAVLFRARMAGWVRALEMKDASEEELRGFLEQRRDYILHTVIGLLLLWHVHEHHQHALGWLSTLI